MLDRISSIARGEVIGGGNRLIDSLATQSRHVLEYQFSRGLCQDFSVDDRRAKENALKEKAKTARANGGSKRRKMNVLNEGSDHANEECVRLGEDEDHVVDPEGEEFEGLFFGETSSHVGDGEGHHDKTETTNVDLSGPSQNHKSTLHDVVEPSPSSWFPNFRLLSSNDFLTPPIQEPVDQHVPQ